MQLLNILSRLVIAAIISLFLLSPVPVKAESPGGDDASSEKSYMLEPVVVEAQKRDEYIQDVPMSIMAFSEKRLEESRIYDFRALDLATPNLSFRNVGSRSNFSFLSIRGLATADSSQDPTVGVYIDDIPITDLITLSSPAFFDMKQIEVLRGPQSTLWGVNTEGGAVLLHTKDPGNSWAGMVRTEAAINDTFLAQAALSGPIIEDKLYLGLAGGVDSTDGFIENVAPGGDHIGEEGIGGRMKVVWTPMDKLEIKLSVFGDETKGDAGFVRMPFDRSVYNATYGTDLDKFELSQDDPGFAKRTSNTQAVNLKYETDWFDLVSVTSRRDVEMELSTDFDQTNIGAARTRGDQESDLTEYSQELRFVSPTYPDLPLEWIAGVFYLNKENKQTLFLDFIGMGTSQNFSIADYDGYNLAGFGQATYRLMNGRLGLTAGLRYEQAKRELDRNDDFVADFSGSKTDSEWLPRFVIDYKLTDNDLVYVSAAKGWRNGGLNTTAPNAGTIEYDKETAWNYELGLKSGFFDNKLLLNAAAFYMAVDDYQESFQQSIFAFYFGNAEEVTLKGFEIDVTAQPLPELMLEAAFGYTDAKYDKYQYSSTVNFDGKRVSNIPEWEFSLISQYTFLSSGFYMRGEFMAIGDSYMDSANEYKQEGYQLYNARVGMMYENFDFYLFGENLSNEFYFIDANAGNDGLFYGSVGKGRSIGMGLSMRF